MTESYFNALEQKIDQILERYNKLEEENQQLRDRERLLKEENQQLRDRERPLKEERAQLSQINEQTQAKIEAMITRLKSLEQNK
ncbi:MAG: cell division protein ZapB [Neptuniibacter sp.]|uniref:cell division protein ZapB n=1 Tax=Neptuniibacter sp. TaxID=1962643 RepID=UPI003B5A9553